MYSVQLTVHYKNLATDPLTPTRSTAFLFTLDQQGFFCHKYHIASFSFSGHRRLKTPVIFNSQTCVQYQNSTYILQFLVAAEHLDSYFFTYFRKGL